MLSSDLRNSFPGRRGECPWIDVGRVLFLELSMTRLCLVSAWNRLGWKEMRGIVERDRLACLKLGRGGSQRSREAWWFVWLSVGEGCLAVQNLVRLG